VPRDRTEPSGFAIRYALPAPHVIESEQRGSNPSVKTWQIFASPVGLARMSARRTRSLPREHAR
jgi:hypothetical protein